MSSSRFVRFPTLPHHDPDPTHPASQSSHIAASWCVTLCSDQFVSPACLFQIHRQRPGTLPSLVRITSLRHPALLGQEHIAPAPCPPRSGSHHSGTLPSSVRITSPRHPALLSQDHIAPAPCPPWSESHRPGTLPSSVWITSPRHPALLGSSQMSRAPIVYSSHSTYRPPNARSTRQRQQSEILLILTKVSSHWTDNIFLEGISAEFSPDFMTPDRQPRM